MCSKSSKTSNHPGMVLKMWNQFNNTVIIKRIFLQILYSDHHWTTVCGKSLNSVFMLPILVVAWKMKWYIIVSKYKFSRINEELQRTHTFAKLIFFQCFSSSECKNRKRSHICFKILFWLYRTYWHLSVSLKNYCI